MRHFLLACELPAIFTLALIGAFVAATAAPAFLSPPVVLAARPYVVAFFLLAALWCALLWIILMLWPPSAAARLSRHEPDQRHQRHHQTHCQ